MSRSALPYLGRYKINITSTFCSVQPSNIHLGPTLSDRLPKTFLPSSLCQETGWQILDLLQGLRARLVSSHISGSNDFPLSWIG